jgi:hypothetical protein
LPISKPIAGYYIRDRGQGIGTGGEKKKFYHEQHEPAEQKRKDLVTEALTHPGSSNAIFAIY